MVQARPTKADVRAVVGDHLTQQYIRKTGVVEPEAGLELLHEQLKVAAQAYEVGPEQQRQAVSDSIIATSEFLKGQGFDSATLVPLHRALRAIVELCTLNRPDPLFSEKPRKTKPLRGMTDSVQQGQLAAFAGAWLKSSSSDEGDDAAKLKRAARFMAGKHFGALDGKKLASARSYLRQSSKHDLVYRSHEQMREILEAEAKAAGGNAAGLRTAIQVQIEALNAKAELQNR